MNKEELNDEYISVLREIRVLNKKRCEIYSKFKTLVEVNPVLKRTVTASLYHDLFGMDIDRVFNELDPYGEEDWDE